MKKFSFFIKRTFDICGSLFLILCSSPILAVLAFLVKISSPGKIIFKQERMGKNQKRFMIYKFRTMKNPPKGTYSVDGVLHKPNGEILEPSITRVTKIGKILRKLSLDELPQLFNILNGTMSFVGPRPTLPYQAEKYDDNQKRRFSVRPGVTGWAQVNGRNSLTWTEKLNYDIEYVDKFSLLLDIKIFFKTVAVVFRKNNIEFNKEDALTAKKDLEKVLVLAGGVPQIELLKQLKARGLFTVLADGSATPVAKEYADKFVQINIFDVETVTRLAQDEKVKYIMTVCADQVLLVVSEVAEKLGLSWYIDYKTAREVSDKTLMKEIFIRNGIPTAKYVIADVLQENLISDMQYPLVVKPVDAYSSKGVRKVQNFEELAACFTEAQKIGRDNKNVIIEEYKAGEEISVDVFVTDGKAKVLAVTNSDKICDDGRFVIYRGKYPAVTTKSVLQKIEKVAQQIAEAFGIQNAPMLIQLISDGKNINVLEFCARTGGNMKYLLIKHICGFDVIQGVIDLTMGISPSVTIAEPENKYIVNDFIYCKKGVFDHLEGFEELLQEGYITDYKQIRAKGFVTNGVTCSSDRVVGVTFQADSVEEFNTKHAYAIEKMKIIDVDGNDIMRHDLLPAIKE